MNCRSRQPRRSSVLDTWALILVFAALPTLAIAQSETTKQPVQANAWLPEPGFVARAIDIATRTTGDGSGNNKSGLYAEMGDMITGDGWISAGPGYRHWMHGDRMFLDASAGWSWRSYKMGRAQFEVTNLARSRVAVGTEFRWQDFTQISYFGSGPESLDANRSEYRLTSANVVGYSNVRPTQWLNIGGRGGWLQQPSLLDPGGTFRRGYPPTQEVFPTDPAFALADQPSYLHGELSMTADTRDHRSHPMRGALYRGAWSRYQDRADGTFSFQRFEAEGAQFVPLADSRITLAAHGWLVASDTAEGRTVPFYMLPSLGGNNTLRGYANYRFHDRHFVVVNVEARFALLAHVDVALFADAGNVAARMADLNFDKQSVGVGVRLHSVQSTFGRMDVAHGSEGWRVAFTTSEPLHLSRLSRRTAVIPFAP